MAQGQISWAERKSLEQQRESTGVGIASGREAGGGETCPGRHRILRFKGDRFPVIGEPSLWSSPLLC